MGTTLNTAMLRFRLKSFWYRLNEAAGEDPFGFDPLRCVLLWVFVPLLSLSLLFLSAAVFSQTCRLFNCERTLGKNVIWYAPAPPDRRKNSGINNLEDSFL